METRSTKRRKSLNSKYNSGNNTSITKGEKTQVSSDIGVVSRERDRVATRLTTSRKASERPSQGELGHSILSPKAVEAAGVSAAINSVSVRKRKKPTTEAGTGRIETRTTKAVRFSDLQQDCKLNSRGKVTFGTTKTKALNNTASTSSGVEKIKRHQNNNISESGRYTRRKSKSKKAEMDSDKGDEPRSTDAGDIEPSGQAEPTQNDGDLSRQSLEDLDPEEFMDLHGSRLFSRNLASASSALQGLLRKLGAGLDDFVPSSYNAQFKTFLATLKEEGNDAKQLEALNSLCDLLSIASEDSLTGFPVESFVPELVTLLNKEHNPDLMLLAARTLTHLADVLPSSCSAIVQYQAIPALCSRLLSIEYIDLAEQSLQALEKVSHEYPIACLRSGALMAALTYLDFFPTGVQRVAMSTAANIVRQIPDDLIDQVLESTTLLTNLLENHDNKVVEQACICLSRITESLSNKPEKLEKLCILGLVDSVHKVTSNPSNSSGLNASMLSSLYKLLATCISSSCSMAIKLLEKDLTKTLGDSIKNSSLISTAGQMSSGNTLRTAEQLNEVLLLLNELLPSFPECKDDEVDGSTLTKISGLLSPSTRPRTASSTSSKANQESFIKTVNERPQLLEKFNAPILSLLMTLHASTVNVQLRHSCLMALLKAMYFSPPDMVFNHFKDLPISSFIARILDGADSGALNAAISMAMVLMLKLPETFAKYFVKEGVIHAIKGLAQSVGEEEVSPEENVKKDTINTRERLEELMIRRSDVLPTPRGSVLKLSAARRASKFLEIHKSHFDGYASGTSEGVKKLIAICDKFDGTDSEAFQGVSDMFEILAIEGESGISTFELISSGLISKLNSFLVRTNKVGSGCIAQEEASMQHLKRFMAIAFKCEERGAPVLYLIRRLQEVLTSIERFPVVLSHVQSGSGMRPLAALSQPFKLRLRRLGGEKSLRDYGSNIVLIEPLATLAAVEEFLWPRVKRNEETSEIQDSDGSDGEQATPSKKKDEKGKAPIDGSVTAKDSSQSKGKIPKNEKVALGIDEPKATDKKIKRNEDTREKDSKKSEEEEDEAEEEEEVDDDDEEEEDDEDDEMEDEDLDEMDEDELPDVPLARSADVHDVRLGDNSDEGLESGPGPSSEPDGSTLNDSRSHGSSRGKDTEGGNRRNSQNVTAEPRLKFSFRDKDLNSSCTILQAVQQSSHNGVEDIYDYARLGRRRLWDEIHTVQYASFTSTKEKKRSSVTSNKTADTSQANNLKEIANKSLNVSSSISPSSLLDTSVPDALKGNVDLEDVLFLLRLLYGLHKGAPEIMYCENYDKTMEESTRKYGLIPVDEFLNSKIASKVLRQLQDPITLCSGSLPNWCSQIAMYSFFLLPFETRRHFLYCTSFGVPRALLRLQQYQSANHSSANDTESRDLRVGRLQRQKVRVQRTRILESAVKVMEMYSSTRAVLEVEYFNEVGTGLGPTLEFYTLLSNELQRKSLELWRDFDIVVRDSNASGGLKDSDMKTSSSLLFPKPLNPDHSKRTKILQYFKMMGSAIGKAILDSRLMDLPLAPAFIRLIRGNTLRDADLMEVDPQIARMLHKFDAVAKRHKDLLAKGKRGDDATVLVDGVEVERLGLDFTYPGIPEYKLRPKGDTIDVTLSSLSQYVDAVKDATLHSGVQAQADAFREGFNYVMSMDVLAPFSEHEIDLLLCGTHESWTEEMLTDAIKFDHGYTSASPPIRQFIRILSELDFEEQRAFLKFVTGCPRLPSGGLSGLTPRLTVVRKQPSGINTPSPGKPANPATNPGTTAADVDLPSVMTCANYLKLPPYSSEKIMKERLLFAIKEGQGSFDLS